ncbi:MAG: carbohydrate kinase family protein [Candidatus Komeilibacteria bacterium]|nr:carbohydrate kinase family protein [Candidatus Komeilibacteria bacterium]
MRLPQYDIITIGTAVQDIFLFLKERDVLVLDNPQGDLTKKKLLALEYGAKIHAARSAMCFGGGALNSAVTFSRLGLKTAVLAALGCDDNATAIVNFLKQENIDTSFITYHSRCQTGFSVLVVDAGTGEHVALVERGANNVFSFSARKRGVASAPWYYLTSLTGSSWEQVLEKITNTIKRQKLFWAWNPGNEQLARGWGLFGRYLKYCTVFILNRDEALELLRADSKEEEMSIDQILTALLHWGPKMVIVTDGQDGAYFADKRQRYHVAASSDLEVMESTGAGDAFGSGFVGGLLATKMQNIPYALQAAMANAESVISKVGAQAGILDIAARERAIKKKKYKIKKI